MSATMQSRLDKQGEGYLATLQQALRDNWKQACEHDGIPPDSSFVVFSSDNPYIEVRGRIQEHYWENLAAYKVGGYVGLRIKEGRAIG